MQSMKMCISGRASTGKHNLRNFDLIKTGRLEVFQVFLIEAAASAFGLYFKNFVENMWTLGLL